MSRQILYALVMTVIGGCTLTLSAQTVASAPDVNRLGPLLNQGKIAEAEALCDSLLAVDEAHLSATTWKAYLHYFKGEYEAAIEAFQRANHFGIATYQFTLYPMAGAYAMLGKKEEALHLLSQAVETGAIKREAVLSDKRLATLKEEPGFSNILKQLEKGSEYQLSELGLRRHVIEITDKMQSFWTNNFPKLDLTNIIDVSLPSNYSKDQSYPVLIWLNPTLQQGNAQQVDDHFKYQAFEIWRKALPEDWIIASPAEYNYGKKGFEKWVWSSAEGIVALKETIHFLKQEYAIDPGRIILGGYHTAAELVWHFAQAQPDEIAGFISIDGHPGRLDFLRHNTHAVNLRHANFLAFNGKNRGI